MKQNPLLFSFMIAATLASCRTVSTPSSSKLKVISSEVDFENRPGIRCEEGEPSYFEFKDAVKDFPLEAEDLVADPNREEFSLNATDSPSSSGTYLRLDVCVIDEKVVLKQILSGQRKGRITVYPVRDFDTVEGLKNLVFDQDYSQLKIYVSENGARTGRIRGILGSTKAPQAFTFSGLKDKKGQIRVSLYFNKGQFEYTDFTPRDPNVKTENFKECGGSRQATYDKSGIEWPIKKETRHYGTAKFEIVSYINPAIQMNTNPIQDRTLHYACKITITDSSVNMGARKSIPLTYLIPSAEAKLDYPPTHHGWHDKALLTTPDAKYGIRITMANDPSEAAYPDFIGYRIRYKNGKTVDGEAEPHLDPE